MDRLQRHTARIFVYNINIHTVRILSAVRTREAKHLPNVYACLIILIVFAVKIVSLEH